MSPATIQHGFFRGPNQQESSNFGFRRRATINSPSRAFIAKARNLIRIEVRRQSLFSVRAVRLAENRELWTVVYKCLTIKRSFSPFAWRGPSRPAEVVLRASRTNLLALPKGLSDTLKRLLRTCRTNTSMRPKVCSSTARPIPTPSLIPLAIPLKAPVRFFSLSKKWNGRDSGRMTCERCPTAEISK